MQREEGKAVQTVVREGQEYICLGEREGYQVFVHFDEDGPEWEEVQALFSQAANSVLFQNLASGLNR